MELNKIYKNVTVNEFHVKRKNDSFTLSFEFYAGDQLIKVKLNGIREPDNLCDILEAKRLWLEESESNQLEFGRFTLGISHECFTEVVCDSFE
ncbi:hypothetical protein C2869_01260 [Saccharobesus litoralis]|uniref:Uncharacterized protein n=1 Tax=Saccharobesus litoralis TaxID=2172099 RepID=A0A2S0VLR2_9ALTE|nr:hypothetical protein [Saccharobesus litoralis]AWB65154.1 hypothetical protein C2869_01260 [Saccharobesus litoralis]